MINLITNSNDTHQNLTASMRWGFLFLVMWAVAVSGCAQAPAVQNCVDPTEISYSAALDSVSLGDFYQLPAQEQGARRAQARHWLDRFAQEQKAHARIQALSNAVGLAPDQPEAWLHLAHLWRWLGDYLKTVDCLDNAAEAVRNHQSGVHTWDKGEMQRRTALARAWLHYDRGEWQQGLQWARAAQRSGTGDKSVRQVYGLLAGHNGLRSEAEHVANDMERAKTGDPDGPWVLATYRVSTGQHRQAFNLIMDATPNGFHQAEAWREMGEIAEQLDEFSRAGRWYEESAHSLPFRDTSCLTRVTSPRLKPGPKKHQQKVWLAYDKFYVTGSYSAYTKLVFTRFGKATTAAEKEFWAGQVVNAAGTLLRKGVDTPWALRARGLVFAQGENLDRGIKDLQRASAQLEKRGIRDLAIESTLGRLFLKKEDHRQAIPHLRTAIELNPKVARVWQDLGLALIMADQGTEAENAFTVALELNPESATSWYNRGLLYLHRKEYGPAVSDLEQAARLAPDNSEVINLLQQASVLERQEKN